MEIFNLVKSKKFELSIVVKDHFGMPTTERKVFSTNSAEELHNFWNRNNGIVKSKKRNTKAATKEQVKKAVKEAGEYAEGLQQRRDNEEV